MIWIVSLLAIVTSVIDGVGFENLSDFIFDVIFWRFLGNSNATSNTSGSEKSATGSASVGSATLKALDAALDSNYKFHHVLAVLRRERTSLRGISAQDEFARWAKQKRLVDALEEKADGLLKEYRFKKMAFSYPATWVLKGFTWASTAIAFLYWRNSVVLSSFDSHKAFAFTKKENAVDTFIIDFLNFILAFPFGPVGSVSVISFFLMIRIATFRLATDFIKPPIAAYVKFQNTPSS